MRVAAIIPARFASSRYPGKPLVPILGLPMVVRVAHIAAAAFSNDAVVVATEDSRIKTVVEAAGFRVVMTSDRCQTGTDRVAEAAAVVDADVYVNVQGDEPMLDPVVLRAVVHAHALRPDVVHNGMAVVGADEDSDSVNLPKVITTETNRLVYMSRRALPGFKDPKLAPDRYFKQVCVYTFARWHLAAFAGFGRKSTLERSEDIEILRFLDLGIPVQMVEVQGGSLAVDAPEDVGRVEAAMKREGLFR
jgi:3-deoxy-manno-octulosonate cytidylyltransferase (CMP-KDO synthetase)